MGSTTTQQQQDDPAKILGQFIGSLGKNAAPVANWLAQAAMQPVRDIQSVASGIGEGFSGNPVSQTDNQAGQDVLKQSVQGTQTDQMNHPAVQALLDGLTKGLSKAGQNIGESGNISHAMQIVDTASALSQSQGQPTQPQTEQQTKPQPQAQQQTTNNTPQPSIWDRLGAFGDILGGKATYAEEQGKFFENFAKAQAVTGTTPLQPLDIGNLKAGLNTSLIALQGKSAEEINKYMASLNESQRIAQQYNPLHGMGVRSPQEQLLENAKNQAANLLAPKLQDLANTKLNNPLSTGVKTQLTTSGKTPSGVTWKIKQGK